MHSIHDHVTVVGVEKGEHDRSGPGIGSGYLAILQMDGSHTKPAWRGPVALANVPDDALGFAPLKTEESKCKQHSPSASTSS